MTRIPLAIQIIIAIIFGLAAGYYTQHMPDIINQIADAFLSLLQLTAIPYIALSMVIGVSQLTGKEARWALKPVLLALLLVGSVILAFVFSAPLAFPDWQNAEFYSANTIHTPAPESLLSLFIIKNPFEALANANIPGVVFFSFLLGLGLIPLNNKEPLISSLNQLLESISTINKVVMTWSPIGIFCIAFRAVSNIEPHTLDGLMVYLLTAFLLVQILSWVVLPVIISMLTPFSYKQIIRATRSSMMAAFATGSFLLVIPNLVEKSKELFQQGKHDHASLDKVPNIVIPLCFSIPIGGKLLVLLFPIFAAWFSGANVGLNDYTNLVVHGVPQLFSSTTVAMPKLLESFNVSATMFEVFVVADNLLTGKLVAMLSVISAFSLVLLISSAVIKKIRINVSRLIRAGILLPSLSIGLFLLLRVSLASIDYQYQGYQNFIDRDLYYKEVAHTVLAQPQVPKYRETGQSALERIKERGFMRVGYFRDDLPYAFHNKNGKLVGFDIAIMHHIASDLGVKIEFVKIYRDQAKSLLAQGYLDMTTGIPVIPDNMENYALSIPYSEQTIAFIVKDERRGEFTQWKNIVDRKELIIGIPETFFYKDAIAKFFTGAQVWEISTPRLFFKEKYQHIDAMLYGAPSASGWNLLYPDYTVVVPTPRLEPVSLAFALSRDDNQFERYIRNWILMKKKNKTIDKLFNYWIAGKPPVDFVNMSEAH
ncbi:cation:dicarboxylase symporter family transporter [Thalassotalea sp. LPB0316]|uniref:cation:dicarboxylate symporter family transporter n=1 Tax=Thalassotalea sp. LPB0316 TaxID=2769490 RepID=UPI00186940DE|nr:cation:dicarboxylase symporter family transporter [Thalassotalea sp. LPB0316]QOL24747.1 cation:dicarboxylase symporter family transporter [Thalassotalea sp. LPB0316]